MKRPNPRAELKASTANKHPDVFAHTAAQLASTILPHVPAAQNMARADMTRVLEGTHQGPLPHLLAQAHICHALAAAAPPHLRAQIPVHDISSLVSNPLGVSHKPPRSHPPIQKDMFQ
ncbi:MAG: hypothetical protein WAZ18_02765 [Alphaproteobacteria bacterium]